MCGGSGGDGGRWEDRRNSRSPSAGGAVTKEYRYAGLSSALSRGRRWLVLVRQRAVQDDTDLELPTDDDNDSPPQTQDGATQTETQNIADTIESLLHDGSEQSLVTACVVLYKHKRSHREDDTEWLEEAVHTAKRARGC